ALMPCNPSIGGPAKGHLTREIDALGGEMGINIDKAAIQMRMLNTGKGPAVRALRAQADKRLYQALMKETLENTDNLSVKQLLVDELLTENGRAVGILCETGERFYADAVIIAAGTYLRSRIIIGETTYDGGPSGQRAAMKLSQNLVKLGLPLMRFKTGTPARIDARSIDYSKTERQDGDSVENFSFMTDERTLQTLPCYLTYTNERTHEILRKNMHRAPMANGIIEGIGPRYCPAIETKILRFPDKERHQLFLEPEGLHTNEVYVQGMSTSMPMDVQFDFLHTIAGLEQCEIMRPGYAIEYDCFDPLYLKPSLESKVIENLYLAGQTNGTSGYEEAAAQGLMAGINATRKLDGKEAVVLKRSDAYIGVLIDDLVTKGTMEPYRMMTSRAENRLLLRMDNADARLTPIGREIGLVTDARYERYLKKKNEIERLTDILEKRTITPSAENLELLEENSLPTIKNTVTLKEYLRRPEADYERVKAVFGVESFSKAAEVEALTLIKYEGYLKKQEDMVEKVAKLENMKIPEDIDYNEVKSLRLEAVEKLKNTRPLNLSQASRISGVSPADISVLMIYLEALRRRNV
ncbi:MAG: tRNA uridine-5-carboxymethylaminomethyl(34) synthesis enzyme MnmG, partial [Selenomonadaceae bacterium]|nr:tRNA uridine-5-carboxymethylaminomethyl(34) synthesis enzyme MnmG [Selenomonadaceae bacterium]